MINGHFLGGVSKGLSQGREDDLLARAQALDENRFRAREERDATARIDGEFNNSVKIIADLLNDAKTNGAPTEPVLNIAKQMLGTFDGIVDPSRLQRAMSAIQASASIPAMTPEMKGQFAGREAAAEAMAKENAFNQASGVDINAEPSSAETITDLLSTNGPVNFLGIDLPATVSPKTPTGERLLQDARDKSNAAKDIMSQTSLHLQLIKSARELGPVTELTQPLVRALSQFGFKVREDQPIIEAVQSSQNALALMFRNPKGPLGGLTGNTSDRDIQFLKAIPGGIENTKEGAELVATMLSLRMRHLAQRAMLEANLRARGATKNADAILTRFDKQVDTIDEEGKAVMQEIIDRYNAKGGGGPRTVPGYEGVTIEMVK